MAQPPIKKPLLAVMVINTESHTESHTESTKCRVRGFGEQSPELRVFSMPLSSRSRNICGREGRKSVRGRSYADFKEIAFFLTQQVECK